MREHANIAFWVGAVSCIFVSMICGCRRDFAEPTAKYDELTDAFIIGELDKSVFCSVEVWAPHEGVYLWRVYRPSDADLQPVTDAGDLALQYGMVPEGWRQIHPVEGNEPEPITNCDMIVFLLGYNYDGPLSPTVQGFTLGFRRQSNSWVACSVSGRERLRPKQKSTGERDAHDEKMRAEMVELAKLERPTFLTAARTTDMRDPHGILARVMMAYVQLDSVDAAYGELRQLDDIVINSNEHISDLSLLVDFPNLEVVKMPGQAITNIAALGSLTNLHTINLSNNNIREIEPLLRCERLHHLNVEGNPIGDSLNIGILRKRGVKVHW